MAVQVRCASQSHLADLIGLFGRHLPVQSNEKRFDWLYRQNPYGQARAWIAIDPEKEKIVGAAAAFPKSFYFQGTAKLGLVLGDFCLDEQYRSIGPALQLQRACLQALAAPYDFCYDFPSATMMAIYKRMGIPQTSSFVRWTKALRVDSKLQSIVGSKFVARTVGVMANALIASHGWKGTRDACQVEVHQGPCGEEFTSLDQKLGASGVRAKRTAEYLNWRYLAHPSKTHVLLAARKGGVLVGYIVLEVAKDHTRIGELISIETPAVAARLLDGAVKIARRDGAHSVHMAVSQNHPWNALFERAGFRPREASPFVVVTRPGATIRETDFKEGCYLAEGERES
jgi:Acetyltransferase (GNAT) domain